jgi:hypothetical protein
MSLATARAIIDAARTRHWAFSSLALGDGAALLFLRARLATHVAKHGAKIEGLVGTTMQYSVPLDPPPLLVASSGAVLGTNFGFQITTGEGPAVPVLGAAYQDGWPVHTTPDGVPYIDFSEPPIAGDPFGRYGGTVGFPLPSDMIRLIGVALVRSCGVVGPCDVIPEGQRFTTLPGRNPAAFVAGNRLVPVMATAPTAGAANVSPSLAGTRWADVAAIQISYVGLQALRALDDALNLPPVLAEALVADTAGYLAAQSKELSAAEKGLFAAEALRVGAAVADAALDVLNEPLESSVHYTG